MRSMKRWSWVPLVGGVLGSVVVLLGTACGPSSPAGTASGKSSPAPADAGEAAPRSEEAEPSGSWWRIRDEKGTSDPREDLSREEFERLVGLGYLGGYEDAPAHAGVVRFDPERAYPGYNLIVSGHAPEAFLTDMTGDVVHRWRHAAPSAYGVRDERNFWRRVHLLEGGELLAIFDPHGIIKLDRRSNLLWATDGSNRIHHDLDVTEDGRIFTLGKRTRKIPEIHGEVAVVEDLVVTFDGEGRVLDRFSIFEAFQRSPYAKEIEDYVRHTARLAAEKGHKAIEDFHTNTIQVFDGSLAEESPLFDEGNMIFCSPHLNNVFIIDGDSHEVVWNWFGPWYRIHEPQVTDRGTFLLFHNSGYKEEDRFSQVLEYDLLSRREVWSYEGDPARPATRFFSGTSSTVARLPNGNTIIVVTESGRVLEVTPAGEVVWEFYNPARAGREDELIAAVFQMERLPREAVAGWLDRDPGDR